MILTDKDILERSKEIIVEGFEDTHVGPISYDLTIDEIILDDTNVKEYVLGPDELVFIKTKEKISIPDDLTGRIQERNSIMRMGLFVSGPQYFPGHMTYVYLRVKNISGNNITLRSGDRIAQIVFEKLASVPNTTYSRESTFQNEDEYRGFGKYQTEYSKRIETIRKEKEELENKENSIYVNIMTIMGVFVSIFSLIMVNFTNISHDYMSKQYLLTINLSLGIVIVLFIGLMLIFLNKAKYKKFLILYLVLLTILIAMLFFLI